uniref:Tudor domain containing 6 n=1 Tax=Athene cunicularia TaxID=194338 RepID=A0A663MK72_ATHCN
RSSTPDVCLAHPGASVALRVCAVGLRPEVPVVRLWGRLGERSSEYVQLRREIQAAAGPRLAPAPGPGGPVAGGDELCPGDVGLVEVLGLWYRCCVVSRRGQDYRVFLLDEGCTVVTSACYLARGSNKLFRLPPEVLGCVVADVMPAGGPGKAACGDISPPTWTVESMEFLSYLHGKEVLGLVQKVVTPQLIVLELPQLVNQMCHLGLAREVAPSLFCQVLKRCLTHGHFRNQLKLQPPACSPVASAVTQADYFYPQLQLGVTEPVIVTHVSDPHHIYCQLQSLSQEILRLSDIMCHAYDWWEQDLLPKVGSPCAARGIDGQWYRALLLELIGGEQDQQVALVIFVDYGRKETVTRANLRHLPVECFRMPVVTYPCALQGILDGGCGWSPSQINELKALVLGKGVSAHIKAFNSYEHLYYVNLYGKDGVNLNHLFGVQTCCLVSSHMQVSALSVELGVFHDVWVSHLRDPSEFWLQLHEHRQLLKQLRQSLWNFYSHAPKLDGASWDLQPGSLCSSVETMPSSSYGGQLEVGSTVNVVVSYVENPGYFWCQLSRNCRDLKILMTEIQEYCKNSSNPYAWPDSVCLAQYSEDEKWYRALITSEIPSAEKVEVLYVDYGNREQVSLTNLRSTNKCFLQLEAQAFRCSLYNLIQPNGQDPFAWDEAAIRAFQEFVDASSSHFELKCTVFALASIKHKELFNIVDLMTPFQSACQFLTERGVARPLSPQKPLVSSVQLHSYYYSMHGIKTGSEEDVFITHVEDPWTFYCQLERCADVLSQLMDNIDRLSEKMTSLKTLRKSGSLCLARYTDNRWYRGLLTKTKPNMEVFFVDFGNTETIEKDHLLPLPNDACDILLLPMQAIRCSLSDISNVPKEATTWFKQAILERQLKAIVVAKKSDGKLLVELFDGSTQINAKLKDYTGLCRHVEDKTLCSRNTNVNERNEAAESPLKAGRPLERNECRSEAQGGGRSSKRHFKEDVNLFQPATKGDVADGLLEPDEMLSSKKGAFVLNKAGEESVISIQLDAQSDIKSNAEGSCIMLKKVSDLLQQKIVPALKVLVYVSHVNDPLDFYVQLESDEAQLNSISEILNNRTQAKKLCGQLFQAGDLISAVYSEDSLWYRAVVKEKTSDNLISIQYIDYGNTSVINVDQAHRLPEDLSSIPAIGIHCFLGGLRCKKNTDWGEKAVLYFTKRTSEVVLTCEFVEKVEDKWEVVLSDHQGIITVDLAEENLASRESSTEENSGTITVGEPLPPQGQNEISCVSDRKSFIWKFPEAGQTAKIHVTVVNGPEYFWSRRADTEAMNYIEEKIVEAENLGLNSLNDCRSCIKSGDICLAKHSQDGKFYRAKVSSIKDDTVVVRHVDYGSEEAVSMEMVREIPCELLKVPNQAFACCLSGFSSSEGSWLSEAKEKFYDMTENLLLEAEVIETQEDKASEATLSFVKLEASGKSINEEMKSFWKANKGTGDNTLSNLENPLKENRSSKDDCLKRETTHQSNFAKEIPLPEGESNDNVLLETMRSCSLHIWGSEMKASEQELCELLFGEDADLKEELIGGASAASFFLGNEQEVQGLPVLQVQSSLSDETGTSVELDQLQKHSSYGDLKELMLELEALSVPLSFGEETKQALETESHEVQTALDSEAREKVLEQELFELPVVGEEMGELGALKSLEILPSLHERENLVPSVSNGLNTGELIPSNHLALREKAKNLEFNLSGVHKQYTCNLKGFAVGSKCVVWTSLKWCEARILEISEKGTRVLNLSSGNEEIVGPENVWNGIPDWAARSSEVWQSGRGLGRTVLIFRKGGLSLVVILPISP